MKKRVLHRILLVLGLSLVSWLLYNAVLLFLDEELQQNFYKEWPFPPLEMLFDYAVFCCFSFMATFYFLKSYDKAEKERDRYKLMALGNQINPHFVFNNFSTLADLIEVNPPKASEYLMNLSKVYRYTLSHLEHDKVSLHDEIEYLKLYLKLLDERFSNTIQVNINTEGNAIQGFVPPAVLQMIVENAIKHNEHTKAHPLVIDVLVDNDYIVIKNRKQSVSQTNSTHVGNHNIEERYRLLTTKKIEIIDNQEYYSVKIPVI
ncbi:MAG: histidine kinase [Bacteroidales bacterium]|nr:histidine kinase [Bacteroidales bacterium]MBR4689026.1 histidine kinase [Bacteroidales bacterium]